MLGVYHILFILANICLKISKLITTNQIQIYHLCLRFEYQVGIINSKKLQHFTLSETLHTPNKLYPTHFQACLQWPFSTLHGFCFFCNFILLQFFVFYYPTPISNLAPLKKKQTTYRPIAQILALNNYNNIFYLT